MNITGNTILISGGTSGIGRGLAEAFHRAGNQIVITGRRQAALDEVTSRNPGMRSMILDVDNVDAIEGFGRRIAEEVPHANILLNNAGIQRPESLGRQPPSLSDVDAMTTTNLLGPIRLTAAILPVLRKNSGAAIVNVTSAIAFVPLVGVATYCATKAAMHAYTVSLRYALKGEVDVVEIIPPYVQTNLGVSHGLDPRAMPLADFIAEVMAILQREPAIAEVVVERAAQLRFAAERGAFAATFESLNKVMSAQSDQLIDQ